MNWQPIETAPKDGTEIFGLFNGFVDVIKWVTKENGPAPGEFWTDGTMRLREPDAWALIDPLD